MRSVRLRIAGTVQGVGYRIWAERTAGTLGIRGWVRNRSDGSVELQAIGPEDAICLADRGLPARTARGCGDGCRGDRRGRRR
jgi:acylphosphatase